MIALLDVNVLIALIDQRHVATEAAQRWFETHHGDGWATCPLTQNGVLRIVGHPNYRHFPGSVLHVAVALQALAAMPGHVFWPDTISLLDAPEVDTAALTSSGQITDTYLLALAAHHGARLATFDARLKARAVRGGAEALLVIRADRQ